MSLSVLQLIQSTNDHKAFLNRSCGTRLFVYYYWFLNLKYHHSVKQINNNGSLEFCHSTNSKSQKIKKKQIKISLVK